MMAHLVNSPLSRRLLDATLLRWARYVIQCRMQTGTLEQVVHEVVRREVPDLVVRHGPFRGMRYPELAAAGSTLFPKLLGSYERELADIIESISAGAYTDIVDIGCAEGYYAVGLAMRIPTATVWAFDTDPHAIALCARMAALNGVKDRLRIGEFCSPDTLAALALSSRPLIVCDCEGYEARLFPSSLDPLLQRCALLIETHDFIDPAISRRLIARFVDSHEVQMISSLDDIKKSHVYNYPELQPYDLKLRRLLLGEQRPAIMEWLWATPRLALQDDAATDGSAVPQMPIELPEIGVR